MYIQADKHRKEYEAQMLLWQAWHQAAFERSKRLPSLKRVLDDMKGKPKEKIPKISQSPEQMLEMARTITLALGGRVSKEIEELELQ
jgi:hypothetical protein